MTVFVLKIIACISMLIDHITYALVPAGSDFYVIGRSIGRIAMPVFCFLLVEGYFHTSSLKKYFVRLSVFAVVSELPFDLLFGLEGSLDGYLAQQNVMITLLIGLAAVASMDYIKKNYLSRPWIYNSLGVFVIVGFCILAEFIRCDYSSMGVLCILVFYFFRGRRLFVSIGFIAWVMLYVYFIPSLEGYAILALVPVLLYNGRPGRKIKYAMYVFYPAHILAVWLVRYVMLIALR